MKLHCEECGESHDFYKREDGTRVTAVDSEGRWQAAVEFEADGFVTYECGQCESEVTPET